ncbi:MAG: hypothetical protein J5858_01820 [Lentisphaeria bacterium]|nr:hypothetical protein [Lentisphaeria bacterium]
MSMESEREEAVSDEAMRELCQRLRLLFASHNMDLFEKVCFDDTLCAAFALSTDDCCFLVDRVRQSMLRDYHDLVQVVKKLTEKEPHARIFGILLVGTEKGLSAEFRLFGKRHNIALLNPENVAGFIEANLK